MLNDALGNVPLGIPAFMWMLHWHVPCVYIIYADTHSPRRPYEGPVGTLHAAVWGLCETPEFSIEAMLLGENTSIIQHGFIIDPSG